MTVKRRSTGELEQVDQGWYTKSFRVAILFLVLSGHPWGRGFLTQLGFEPIEVKVAQTTKTEVDRTKEEIVTLQTDVKNLQKGFQDIELEVRDTNRNVENIAKSIQGFQIDFEKYRKNLPQ